MVSYIFPRHKESLKLSKPRINNKKCALKSFFLNLCSEQVDNLREIRSLTYKDMIVSIHFHKWSFCTLMDQASASAVPHTIVLPRRQKSILRKIRPVTYKVAIVYIQSRKSASAHWWIRLLLFATHITIDS